MKKHLVQAKLLKTTLFVVLCLVAVHCSQSKKYVEYNQIKSQALEELRSVLQEQTGWVKVHAAEFLLWAGYPDGVKAVYQDEESHYSTVTPYRIGIWRVLAQAADTEEEKEGYIEKILEAFLDTAGADRIHASETLAKLERSPAKANAEVTAAALTSDVKALAWYTRWAVAFDSADSRVRAKKALLEQLSEEDPTARIIAAYSLRKIGGLSQSEWKTLSEAAAREPTTSPASVYLLSAALITADDAYGETEKIYSSLRDFAQAPGKGERMEMCIALAEKGSENDIPLLVALLNNETPLGREEDDADVRAAAAFALLKIID